MRGGGTLGADGRGKGRLDGRPPTQRLAHAVHPSCSRPAVTPALLLGALSVWLLCRLGYAQEKAHLAKTFPGGLPLESAYVSATLVSHVQVRCHPRV